jgi:hypothetical protein
LLFIDFTFAPMGSMGQWIGKHMPSKAREYLAKAAQHEERARKTRSPEDREWQMVLARAYRILAEVEAERKALPVREIRANRAAA